LTYTYFKITTRYGKEYEPKKTTISVQENPEWWSLLVDEIKVSFMDEDTTSVSIRRIIK